MEIVKNIKLRYANLSDIFQGDMGNCSKKQAIRPGTPYFILEHEQMSLHYIPNDLHCSDTFAYLLIQFYNKKILIVDHMYSNAPFSKKHSLKTADLYDLWKGNYYFYFNGIDFNGPYQMNTSFDTLPNNFQARNFLEAQRKGLLYVLSDN